MHGFLTLEDSDQSSSEPAVTLYSESSSEPQVTLYSEAYSDLYSSELYIVVEPIEELFSLYSEWVEAAGGGRIVDYTVEKIAIYGAKQGPAIGRKWWSDVII